MLLEINAVVLASSQFSILCLQALCSAAEYVRVTEDNGNKHHGLHLAFWPKASAKKDDTDKENEWFLSRGHSTTKASNIYHQQHSA